MQLYCRFSLMTCLKLFGPKLGLGVWSRDLRLGWRLDGWRTLVCP